MKVAYLFFLSICFLLLGGYYCSFSSVYQEPSYLHSHAFASTQNLPSLNFNQPSAAFTDIHINEDKGYILSLEDEDDDIDFARRYILMVKCFVVLSYSFIFSIFYNYTKDTLPFFKHLSYCSYKYILQRVLRI